MLELVAVFLILIFSLRKFHDEVFFRKNAKTRQKLISLSAKSQMVLNFPGSSSEGAGAPCFANSWAGFAAIICSSVIIKLRAAARHQASTAATRPP